MWDFSYKCSQELIEWASVLVVVVNPSFLHGADNIMPLF